MKFKPQPKGLNLMEIIGYAYDADILCVDCMGEIIHDAYPIHDIDEAPDTGTWCGNCHECLRSPTLPEGYAVTECTPRTLTEPADLGWFWIRLDSSDVELQGPYPTEDHALCGAATDAS